MISGGPLVCLGYANCPTSGWITESSQRNVSASQNDGLVNHSLKSITIPDLEGIVTLVYNVTHTARNMVADFVTPGIRPFSTNAFSDDDFQWANVTNLTNNISCARR